MWESDLDPSWSAHPRAWHEAFPHGSMSQGRALLRQIRRLGLDDVSADAELDIVAPGTPAAEFYQLSMAAMQQRCVDAGILTSSEATALTSRPTDPDFLGCGFAYIGAWGHTTHAGLNTQLAVQMSRMSPICQSDPFASWSSCRPDAADARATYTEQ
jgi:hypothetical protein